MRRFGAWMMVAAIAGCGPAVATDSTADSDSDSDDETGADETTEGDDTGPPPADTAIDCAELPDDGEVLGGEPLNAFGFPPPCNPRLSGNGTYTCCSDDPAAVGGNLPDYLDKGINGSTPFFSGNNNAIGTSGQCIRTSDIPAGSGLVEPAAANCPIPCNPTWPAASLAAVCGAARVCCQIQPLQAEDCILDGDTWRPVTGFDIGEGTDWANGRHATHQDPGGIGCTTFAGGSGPGNPTWIDCISWLTVANQRGYCMSLGSELCPHTAPGFIDACTQINMGIIPPPG